MFPNYIEIVCVHMVQPIIDFMGFLLMEVHFIGYLAFVAFLGSLLGLIFGIVSVIWYKLTREKPEQRITEGGESA